MDTLKSFSKNGYKINLSEYKGTYLVAIHGPGMRLIKTYKIETNALKYFNKLQTSYNYAQEALKI